MLPNRKVSASVWNAVTPCLFALSLSASCIMGSTRFFLEFVFLISSRIQLQKWGPMAILVASEFASGVELCSFVTHAAHWKGSAEQVQLMQRLPEKGLQQKVVLSRRSIPFNCCFCSEIEGKRSVMTNCSQLTKQPVTEMPNVLRGKFCVCWLSACSLESEILIQFRVCHTAFFSTNLDRRWMGLQMIYTRVQRFGVQYSALL